MILEHLQRNALKWASPSVHHSPQWATHASDHQLRIKTLFHDATGEISWLAGCTGETFLYFLKSIKKEKQRSTEYTSNRSINPSKASCPSRTSHKPKQLDVSKEINSAQAWVSGTMENGNKHKYIHTMSNTERNKWELDMWAIVSNLLSLCEIYVTLISSPPLHSWLLLASQIR